MESTIQQIACLSADLREAIANWVPGECVDADALIVEVAEELATACDKLVEAQD